MAAKPLKTLELHPPMIQFFNHNNKKICALTGLIHVSISQQKHRTTNCGHDGACKETLHVDDQSN